MTVFSPRSRLQGMKQTSGLFLLMLALAAGCTPASVRWFREDVHPIAVKSDRRLDKVKIWSGDSVFKWRDVLITQDSISGTPSGRSDCEHCRRALPTSVVDSLDVGYDGSGGGVHSDDGKGTPWWTPLLILAAVLCP